MRQSTPRLAANAQFVQQLSCGAYPKRVVGVELFQTVGLRTQSSRTAEHVHSFIPTHELLPPSGCICVKRKNVFTTMHSWSQHNQRNKMCALYVILAFLNVISPQNFNFPQVLTTVREDNVTKLETYTGSPPLASIQESQLCEEASFRGTQVCAATFFPVNSVYFR